MHEETPATNARWGFGENRRILLFYPLHRLIKVSSEATQWEEVVAMEWEAVVTAWEEALEWVVATEVDMEWEDLQEESEAPALEAWKRALETGSAWSARM